MKRVPETWHVQKQMLESGDISATGIVHHYLEHIKIRDAQIRALSGVFDQQPLAFARAIDAGEVTGGLSGLCLVIKDMIDVAGANCSGGLDYLNDRYADRDSAIVANLRSLGANIIAISVSDTGGFGIRTPSVTHPTVLGRIVGGSSGGSAAAVKAGFSPVALGTDSGGSIRIPAACCSLVGYKPTWGKFAMEGVLPFSPTLDHLGFLANSVTDIFEVVDALDRSVNRSKEDLSPGLIRIGVDHDSYEEADSIIKAAMEELEGKLVEIGFQVVPIKLPDPDDFADIHTTIAARESTEIHGRFVTQSRDIEKQVVKFTIDYGSSVTDHHYEQACKRRDLLQKSIDEIFESVDYLVTPVMPCLTPEKSEDQIKLGNEYYPVDAYLRRYTALFNASRHPVVSLPIKEITKGLTASAQFAAPGSKDSRLLRFALLIESVINRTWYRP